MKRFIWSLLFVTATQLSAHAAQTPMDDAYQTQKARLACGLSADVKNYIAQTIGPSERQPIPTNGEENARYFWAYDDGSWVIEIEFYSLNADHDNFSCIVARGTRDQMIDAVTRPVSTLPKGIISTIRSADTQVSSRRERL